MVLRYFLRRHIRRCTQNDKNPVLQTLNEAKYLIFLSQLKTSEAVLLLNLQQSWFPEAESIVLINLNPEKKLTVLNDGQKVLVDAGINHITLFGGFSKPFSASLKGLRGDILINTDNTSSNLLHLIAACLPADLKCGMHNPFDISLYNPLITPGTEHSPEAFIATVNNYLKSLTGK